MQSDIMYSTHAPHWSFLDVKRSSSLHYKDSALPSRSGDFKKGELYGRKSPVTTPLNGRQSPVTGPLNGRQSPAASPFNGNYHLPNGDAGLYGSASSINNTSSKHPAARQLDRQSGLSSSVDRLFPISSIRHNSEKEKTSTKPTDVYRTSREDISTTRVGQQTKAFDTYRTSHEDLSTAQYGGMVFSLDEVEKIKSDYERQIQDLKVDQQSKLLAKDREWDRKVQACKAELAATQERADKAQQKCTEIAATCADYEKTMTDLLDSKDGGGSSPAEVLKSLSSERDQYAEDLAVVEASFTDLHKRFDKLRATTIVLKQNEEKLKAQLVDKTTQLKESSEQFQKLKDQAQAKLVKAAEDMERLKSSNQVEMTRLLMAVKKAELHAEGLEKQLHQKIKENEELTKICDNLISLKSGS